MCAARRGAAMPARGSDKAPGGLSLRALGAPPDTNAWRMYALHTHAHMHACMRITLIGKIGTVDWRRGSKMWHTVLRRPLCVGMSSGRSSVATNMIRQPALRVHVPQYSPNVLQPYFVCTV